MFEQVKLQLVNSQDRREWEQFEWAKTKDMDAANIAADQLTHERTTDRRDYELEEDKFEHQQEVDEQEIAIERTQKRGAHVGS